MSSIIKSASIRSQGIIDLSSRGHKFPLESSNEPSDEQVVEEVEANEMRSVAHLLQEKQEEFARLNSVIQEKLLEATREAECILAKAIEEANQMKEEANQMKEEAVIEKNALLEEAYHQQEEVLRCAEDKVAQIKKEALEEKKAMLEAVEGDVVETIITLLQHIISEELTIGVDWLKMIVRRMLLQEDVGETVTLLISKENMNRLGKEKEALIASLSKLASIEASDTLNDTTCILVTKQGNIEYDINEGLNKMIAELRVLKGLS